MANLFLDDRRANGRRFGTLEEYETELKLRLLPPADEKLPRLGPRNVRNIKRADMKAHFNALRKKGCTVSQVNKTIKAAKAAEYFGATSRKDLRPRLVGSVFGG